MNRTIVNLSTGKEAREILEQWKPQPQEGRWKSVLRGDEDDEDLDFALYAESCIYDNCSQDVLVGFGGSGDSSDKTLAICKVGHVLYFDPGGSFRREDGCENDCWLHAHAGPDPCTDPDHQK